jgi:hypothetical protein
MLGGEVLARGKTSPALELRAGRHELRLVSRTLFLDRRSIVTIREGETAGLRAPAVGKISVRAFPENCEILIAGRFVDYPPILEKRIVAGRHRIGFRWPDGARRDEEVEVPAGGIAYVMGRRK